MAIYFYRDLFIICPAVDMAEFCSANTRSSVHIYHLPEDAAYNRCLSFYTLNIILYYTEVMVPFVIRSFTFKKNLIWMSAFTKRLCYDILNENDKIRKKFKPHFKPTLLILHSSIHLSSAFHCHPNQPLAASRTSFSKFLPPWPQFIPHPGGRGYKQLSFTLKNRRTSRVLSVPSGLNMCQLWSPLLVSTALHININSWLLNLKIGR